MKNDAGVVVGAARTLERMRAYVHASIPRDGRAAVFSELSRLPPETLASLNPVEAEHMVESVARRVLSTCVQEDAAVAPDAKGTVVCASRASALAMTQARLVASKLAIAGIATTILTVTTTGDRVQDRPLAAIGSQSLFVKELEIALREGRADYAVHSCKDLPSEIPGDMRIVAISAREDPRDVFCSDRYPSFASLPAGARVGTSSMRRRAQLAAMRPDLVYADIRGNVDTRLRKLREGAFDAIVLAAAGLSRLHASATYTVPFETSEIVPAAGQGSLAIETPADADLAPELRAALNDERAEIAVLCERAALRALRGGCQTPVGIHARFEDERLVVSGVVAAVDGSQAVRGEMDARSPDLAQAQALGEALAKALLQRGAESLLAPPKDPA